MTDTHNYQEQYHKGQFFHPVYPPWKLNSSFGFVQVYQAYHLKGLTYYQTLSTKQSILPSNLPGNGGSIHIELNK